MNEIWNTWLQDTPAAQYFSWAGGLGGSPAMKRYYGNQYGDMYNKYQGALGTSVGQGQSPTYSFADWLKQFNATGNYQGLPSYMRGVNYGMTPSYRWLLY